MDEAARHESNRLIPHKVWINFVKIYLLVVIDFFGRMGTSFGNLLGN